MRSEFTSVVSSSLSVAVRTLVVDEECRSREHVRFVLERTDDIEVIGEFGSAVEALHTIQIELQAFLGLSS